MEPTIEIELQPFEGTCSMGELTVFPDGTLANLVRDHNDEVGSEFGPSERTTQREYMSALRTAVRNAIAPPNSNCKAFIANLAASQGAAQTALRSLGFREVGRYHGNINQTVTTFIKFPTRRRRA